MGVSRRSVLVLLAAATATLAALQHSLHARVHHAAPGDVALAAASTPSSPGDARPSRNPPAPPPPPAQQQLRAPTPACLPAHLQPLPSGPELEYVFLSDASTRAMPGRFTSIGSWRHTKPPELRRMVYQQAGGVEGDGRFFVRAGPAGLTLGAERWVLAGGRLPEHTADIAASGPAGRQQVAAWLAEARALGLNSISLPAFNDGHTQPYAIQVAPGVIDEQALREGLDWVLWQARLAALRVVIVLCTAGPTRRGGAAQYVRWLDPAGSLHDFYTNDTFKVQARYFDWITAMAVRENVYTGVQYRHDPTLLGWDILDSPMDAGPQPGSRLQGWVPYMASFLRRMDPNHLILIGTAGLFGSSSPHHLPYNPDIQMRLPWLQWPPRPDGSTLSVSHLQAAPVCEGLDFLRVSMLREVDVSVAAVWPDAWLACDDAGKLAWARDWVAAHVRDALRMQKPLLISDVDMGGGDPSRQAALQALVLGYLANATRAGMPIAGALIRLPSLTACSAWGAQRAAGWNVTCHAMPPPPPHAGTAWDELKQLAVTEKAGPVVAPSRPTEGNPIAPLQPWRTSAVSWWGARFASAEKTAGERSAKAGSTARAPDPVLPGGPDASPAGAACSLAADNRQQGCCSRGHQQQAESEYWHMFLQGAEVVACLEEHAAAQLQRLILPARIHPPTGLTSEGQDAAQQKDGVSGAAVAAGSQAGTPVVLTRQALAAQSMRDVAVLLASTPLLT